MKKRVLSTLKVFILAWLAFSALGYIVLLICDTGVPAVGVPYWKEKSAMLIGGLIGCLYGFLNLLRIHSQSFWKLAKEVEKKIDEAETKTELNHILNEDIVSLDKMAGGNPHFSEVSKLRAVIETKMKYVK